MPAKKQTRNTSNQELGDELHVSQQEVSPRKIARTDAGVEHTAGTSAAVVPGNSLLLSAVFPDGAANLLSPISIANLHQLPSGQPSASDTPSGYESPFNQLLINPAQLAGLFPQPATIGDTGLLGNAFSQLLMNSSASDTASESVSPYQLLMNSGNTGLFGNVSDPLLMNPQPANVLNTFNSAQTNNLVANLSQVLIPTILGNLTQPILQPENQPSCSTTHLSGAHLTAEIPPVISMGNIQPTAEYTAHLPGAHLTAEILSVISAGNTQPTAEHAAHLSAAHLTAEILSVISAGNTQPTAEHENNRTHFSPSVEGAIGSLDYFIFNQTFTDVFKKEEANKNSAKKERNWIFGIITILSRLLTRKAHTRNTWRDMERVMTMKCYLNGSFLLQQITPLLRRISTIVEEENNKNSNVFPCELYPLFYTLVMIVGSVRNSVLDCFSDDVADIDQLRELVVHEIIYFLEEKCEEFLPANGGLGGQDEVNSSVKTMKIEQKHFVQCFGKLHRTYNCDMDILESLYETVMKGFFFVDIWHDFPTSDVLLPLVARIKSQNLLLKERITADQPPLQVVKPTAQIVQPTESTTEYSTISGTIGMLSVVHAYLNGKIEEDEPDSAALHEILAIPTKEQITEEVEKLLTVGGELREALVNGINLGEAITKFHEFRNFVEKVCELLLIERNNEKRRFFNWKENSKCFIENLLSSSESLDDLNLNILRSVFNYLKERQLAHSKVLLETKRNFPPLLSNAMKQVDYLSVLKLMITLLETIRPGYLPEVPHFVDIRNSVLVSPPSRNFRIDGRMVELKVVEANNNVYLCVGFLQEKNADFVTQIIDPSLMNPQINWSKLSNQAENCWLREHKLKFQQSRANYQSSHEVNMQKSLEKWTHRRFIVDKRTVAAGRRLKIIVPRGALARMANTVPTPPMGNVPLKEPKREVEDCGYEPVEERKPETMESIPIMPGWQLMAKPSPQLIQKQPNPAPPPRKIRIAARQKLPNGQEPKKPRRRIRQKNVHSDHVHSKLKKNDMEEDEETLFPETSEIAERSDPPPVYLGPWEPMKDSAEDQNKFKRTIINRVDKLTPKMLRPFGKRPPGMADYSAGRELSSVVLCENEETYWAEKTIEDEAELLEAESKREWEERELRRQEEALDNCARCSQQQILKFMQSKQYRKTLKPVSRMTRFEAVLNQPNALAMIPAYSETLSHNRPKLYQDLIRIQETYGGGTTEQLKKKICTARQHRKERCGRAAEQEKSKKYVRTDLYPVRQYKKMDPTPAKPGRVSGPIRVILNGADAQEELVTANLLPVVWDGQEVKVPGLIQCHRCESKMRLSMRRATYRGEPREYPAYRCLLKGCQTFRSIKNYIKSFRENAQKAAGSLPDDELADQSGPSDVVDENDELEEEASRGFTESDFEFEEEEDQVPPVMIRTVYNKEKEVEGPSRALESYFVPSRAKSSRNE